MPTYDDEPVKNVDSLTGFDLSDLLFSFSRPISLCAMELDKFENNKIVISNKLKNVGAD